MRILSFWDRVEFLPSSELGEGKKGEARNEVKKKERGKEVASDHLELSSSRSF